MARGLLNFREMLQSMMAEAEEAEGEVGNKYPVIKKILAR